MNRLAIFLLLSCMPLLSSQTLRDENFGIHTGYHGSRLFVSKVPDFSKMDLKNMKAFFLERDGKIAEWQALKRGRGKTTHLVKQSGVQVGSYTDLKWQQLLDSEHMIVDYGWVWMGGSSSQSDVIQVFELRDGKVFITQQIEVDTHGGGTIAGAWFNKSTKRLTAKAVELDSPKGRCCPTHLNIVVFRWDGAQFRQISARQAPMPAEKYTGTNHTTASRGTKLLPASR